jgi:hypothetical protein
MKTLTIENLLYEELIMLQEIMVMIDNMNFAKLINFATNLDSTERKIFAELYNKIIQS